MFNINPLNYVHVCLTESSEDKKPILSLWARMTDLYQTAIQDFSQMLFRKGWTISSMIIPSLFGEFDEVVRSSARKIFGWKDSWEKHGFYDAGNPDSLNLLRVRLNGNDPAKDKTPVLLFHGLMSSPDTWLPWAGELQKAEKENKIGHVITLQLPSNLKKRMEIVYKIIDEVAGIYKEANGGKNVPVDLIGHSQGGYAAHLATVRPEYITLKDENGVERRWHSMDPAHRNENVRKVISLGASTWLCCQGQHDETTHCEPHKEDIYPWKVFSEKSVEKSFSPAQLDAIRASHENIYDFIGTHDGISAIVSPLPENQVFMFRHAHKGIVSCPEVCKIAVRVLSQ